MQKTIQEAILDLLVQTPALLIFLVSSFFSGHLWLYMLFTLLLGRTRYPALMNSRWGKISIGIPRMALVFLMLNLLNYHTFDVTLDHIQALTAAVIAYSFSMQILLFLYLLW
jgi:hypothetical protein